MNLHFTDWLNHKPTLLPSRKVCALLCSHSLELGRHTHQMCLPQCMEVSAVLSWETVPLLPAENRTMPGLAGSTEITVWSFPVCKVTENLHRLSTRAGSGEASWNFTPSVWRDYFFQHDSWQQCPADLKWLSLHWLDPVRTQGSSLLKSLSRKMETKCAVSKPQNSNNQ